MKTIKQISKQSVLPSPEDIREVMIQISKYPTKKNLDCVRDIADRMMISPWFYWGSNYAHAHDNCSCPRKGRSVYCPKHGKKHMEFLKTIPLAYEGHGPYFYKVLKCGEVRFLENESKIANIIEYVVDIGLQHQWHFLTLMRGGKKIVICDFESFCGYDRGPKFFNLLKKMWRKLENEST
jgi:hypothetical protein